MENHRPGAQWSSLPAAACTVKADIRQPDSFRTHLLAIARIEAPEDTDNGDSWINDYELEVAETVSQEPTLVLCWQKES